MCSKGCLRFVSFCLDLELFAKIKKDLVSTHSEKPGLLITKDPNTMKKSLEPFCRRWQRGNMCKISGENMKFYGSYPVKYFDFPKK